MEKRISKVNISSAGGTASPGSKTCKVTIPNAWVTALGIDELHREIELTFDGNQVNLTRSINIKEFASQRLADKHNVHRLQYYDGSTLCTTIIADFTSKDIKVENYVSNPVKTAFGNNILPTWDDFYYFLHERCIPSQRAGLREYLEAIGVGEFDPLEIIKKTEGRTAEDNQWLEMEAM